MPQVNELSWFNTSLYFSMFFSFVFLTLFFLPSKSLFLLVQQISFCKFFCLM